MNARLNKGLMVLLSTLLSVVTYAQSADSVVIRVGKESKVIFSIKDKKDLETLKHYNFQALMDDMVQKLENRDTTAITKPSSEYRRDTSHLTALAPTENWEKNSNNEENHGEGEHRRWGRRTHHSFNIDVGMNNYLQDGKFPDASNQPYTVRPWGSWYVGLNSTFRTRMSRHFLLEWGGSVTWYNFKFDNEKMTLTKDNSGVIFAEDSRDLGFRKSKLTAAYVNLSAVPMFEFGSDQRKSTIFGHYRTNTFRIGLGPYAGYRIDSYTKQMYYENGEKTKSHDHDNFYLNNIRYGLRLQMGFRDTDVFFSYDMNELFSPGKGPQLHAFTFGFTL